MNPSRARPQTTSWPPAAVAFALDDTAAVGHRRHPDGLRYVAWRRLGLPAPADGYSTPALRVPEAAGLTRPSAGAQVMPSEDRASGTKKKEAAQECRSGVDAHREGEGGDVKGLDASAARAQLANVTLSMGEQAFYG